MLRKMTIKTRDENEKEQLIKSLKNYKKEYTVSGNEISFSCLDRDELFDIAIEFGYRKGWQIGFNYCREQTAKYSIPKEY